MSHWHEFTRRLFTPIDVQHTVAPADVVPLDDLLGEPVVLDDTPAAVDLEQGARLKHAARIVHRTLVAESLKEGPQRNVELMDLCLELRSTLRPSAPGSEVLREVPPVGIRYPAPVVPGGAS